MRYYYSCILLFLLALPLTGQEFPFPLPATVAAQVNVLSGTESAFSEKLISVNIDWNPSIYQRQGYDHPDAQAFMRRYNPASVRWPQGVWANFYDWEVDGRRRYDDYDNREYTDQIENNQVLRYGFDGFKALHDDLKFDVLWTFNLNYDSNEKSVRRLRDREAKGFDVMKVELGNEQFWLNQRSERISTPEKYVAVAKSLSAALKEAKPDIQLSIPVSWRRGQNGSNINHTEYNNILTADPTYFDALSVHRYVHLDRGAAVVSPESYRGVLTAGQVIQEDVDYCRSLAPGKPVWLTEWGVSSGYQAASYLGMADAYLHIFENRDIYAYTNWFQINAYNAFYDTRSVGGEIRIDKRGFGVVHEMLTDVFLDSDLLDTEVATYQLAAGSGAVVARAAVKDGITTVFAVNKTPQSVILDLSLDGTAYTGPFQQDALAFDSLAADRIVAFEEKGYARIASGSGTITLPPYSVNKVALTAVTGPGMGQLPYADTLLLPGTVEAEYFDRGGANVAYYDTDAPATGNVRFRDNEAVDIDTLAGGYAVRASPGEWLEYTVQIPLAGAYDFDVHYSGGDAGATLGARLFDTLTLFNAEPLMPTAGDDSYGVMSKPAVELPAGTFTLRFDLNGSVHLDRVEVSLAQTPYAGPNLIPGVLESENYDVGGQGKSYNDKDAANTGSAGFRTTEGVDISNSNGGLVTANNQFGEWQEFTVTVADSGSYNFVFTYAAGRDNARISVERMGYGLIVPDFDLPNTGGFGNFQNASRESVFLPAGEHVLRFRIVSGGFNLDRVAVLQDVEQAPFQDVIAIPGTLEAENYDIGGPGQAYQDSDPGNRAGEYRMDDVDIGTGPDGDGFIVGYNVGGEWQEYTVEVARSGYYSVDFLYSSGRAGGGLIGLEFPDAGNDTIVSGFALPQTASWGTYDTVKLDSLELTAGIHVLRINVERIAYNLDKLVFSYLPRPQLPYAGAIPVPGVIQAEYFDTGGEGVSYSDADPENRGNAGFRPEEGVEIDLSTMGELSVRADSTGEWQEYTLDVRESGEYNLIFYTTVEADDASLEVAIMEGGPVVGPIALRRGQSGRSSQGAIPVQQVPLTAGPSVLRITTLQPGFNLDRIKAVRTGTTQVKGPQYQTLTGVAPNPSPSGVFYLPKSTDWSVYSLTGSLLRTSYGSRVDLQLLPRGIYLLHSDSAVTRLIYR